MSARVKWLPVLLALLCFTLAACRTEDDSRLITSYNELMTAINEAENGDTLLVGDIDFSPLSPDVPNSVMNIEIGKDITLKSGKSDGAAVFTNGSLLLSGSKISGEKTVCRFENIVFDGKADFENLCAADYEYPWSEAEQTYTYNAPKIAQQAISFKGNVDVSFLNCSFINYMHEYGPVIDIRYGDYTDNPYLLDLFGDHSACKLNINFDNCLIKQNSALYDGGAIYIESNTNVNLTANNTVFSENRSTVGDFSRGGGAIFASGAILEFNGCTFDKNTANHAYADSPLPEYDTHKGGAILLESSTLKLVNSKVFENRASMGGGISMTNSKADIDGCFFTQNRTEANISNPELADAPWSNMAQGGAIYVEGISNDTVMLTNCEVKENSAAVAYGGIYGFYSPHEDPSFGTYFIKMNLCTYENNSADTVYDYQNPEIYPWTSHAGDMFANPHLSMLGCSVVDESFARDFPREQLASAENGYNELSSKTVSPTEKTRIPTEEAEKILGDRYGGKLKRVYVGSNYSASLYQPDSSMTGVFVVAIALILILSGTSLALKKRKTLKAAVEEPEAPAPENKPQIVMTRYDDADVDRFVSLYPKTALLTKREMEVFRELLRGRKQGEIAYYLGIEVSTVKDYNKKIYAKLDVANKDELFIRVTETLKTK